MIKSGHFKKLEPEGSKLLEAHLECWEMFKKDD